VTKTENSLITAHLKRACSIGSLALRPIRLQVLRSLPIVVILIVAALLRLKHITQPFTDAFSWRQSSTAMMADHFYHTNWNILYPEVSWGGPGPSYQGREFQTVTYIAALLYNVFGQQDWIGRSVAVGFGLWGIFALYQFVRRVWDEQHAVASAAVMALLPGGIFIERSFLPDPAAVALVTTSFWMLAVYLQTECWRYLLLAGLIGAWGFCTKLPGLIVGLPMAYATVAILGHNKTLYLAKLVTMIIAGISALIPVIAYYLWARHLSLSYPPYHFAGSGNWLWNYGVEAWWNQGYFLTDLFRHVNDWMWTGPVIALVALGLLSRPPTLEHDLKRGRSRLSIRSPGKGPWVFHWWFLAGAIYYFIGAKELVGNPWNLHIVNPAAAALAGHAIVVIASLATRLTRRSASPVTGVLLLLTIGIFGQRSSSYMYTPCADQSHKLGLALREITESGELVVTMANASGDPVAIYYSQRRGWVFPPAKPGLDWGRLPEDDNEAIRLFEELRAKGAAWLGIVNERRDFWRDHPTLVGHIERTCELQLKTSEYVIYRILSPEEVANLPPPQDQVDASSADVLFVMQEIRYLLPEAGEVFLVWGIDGWATVPTEIRPNGTVVQDALMYTPMVHESDTFAAKVQVPASATIDYVFQVTKARSGAVIEVWDANGNPKQDYHTVAVQGNITEVRASPLVAKRISTNNLDSESPCPGLLSGIGICIVLGTIAVRTWLVHPLEHHPKHGPGPSDFSASTRQRGLLAVLTTITWRRLLTHGSLAILCMLFTVAITFVYISSEHTFYCWDYAAYHDMTIAKATYFRELAKDPLRGALEALKEIRTSTAREYSDFHTLLIVPFILTWGDSRLAYVLTIALIYLLPYTLITGAIGAKLIPSHPRPASWSAALLTLSVPAAWLPTLRGYPDTGSAALIGVAILVYLHDPKLKHWWQIVLIGFCIASAILFRRHFVYDGITFFVAITLQALITCGGQMGRHTQEALRGLLSSGMRIGSTAASTMVILAILGWPFIDRVLNTSFGALYASYQVPFGRSLEYYSSFYGWIACILAGLGIVVGIRNRTLARPAAVFIALFESFSLLQWFITVKQLGFHYTLHFTLGIVLGLVALGWTAWMRLKGRTRTLALSAIGICFVCNAIVGLAPAGTLGGNISTSLQSLGIRELFSANHPPQVREDYDEITRLTNYLHTIASAEEPIYVAASSDILSDDLLWHAERTLRGNILSCSFDEFWQSKDLNLLHWVPFVDSRDYYPLEKLLQSQYVVVATPFQYHMRPEEQDVVKVVVDAFTENWRFAHDFTCLPEQFQLADGVVVKVYKRVRATSLETALRTLENMREYIGPRPGGQLSWISASGVSGSYITKHGNNSYDIAIDLRVSDMTFLYLDELPDQALIVGELSYCDDKCISGLTLTSALVDANGKVISTTKLVQYPGSDSRFLSALHAPGSNYLLLNLSADYENDLVDHCWLSIHDLAISAE
jgi:hypothetical protein